MNVTVGIGTGEPPKKAPNGAEQTGWANSWLLFDTYLNAVAQTCTDSTVAKWGGKLGAVDVFTWGHCWKLAEALRVD